MAAIVLLERCFRRKKQRPKEAVTTKSTRAPKLVPRSKQKCVKVNKAKEVTQCRICLNKDQRTIYIPIFQGDCNSCIAEDIKKFGDVEVTENDSLPKVLCEGCHNLLQAAILFRTQAQATDLLLRSPVKYSTEVSYSNDSEDSNDNNDSLSWYQNDIKEQNKQVKCDRCQIEFFNEQDYTEHIRSGAHRKKHIKCPECQQLVAFRYLPIHMMRAHDAVQPFVCDVCGKSFPVKGALTRHMMTHSDKLPFKCVECPYRGRFRESLKLHMRVHTGEKPYACEQCPAQFINASNLNKHKLTHRSPDFKCELCDRGFYTKLILDNHLRVDHTGLKEHRCDICGKEFAYRKQMMKHTRKVHHRPKLSYGRLPIYLQVEKRLREQEQIEQSTANGNGESKTN